MIEKKEKMVAMFDCVIDIMCEGHKIGGEESHVCLLANYILYSTLFFSSSSAQIASCCIHLHTSIVYSLGCSLLKSPSSSIITYHGSSGKENSCEIPTSGSILLTISIMNWVFMHQQHNYWNFPFWILNLAPYNSIINKLLRWQYKYILFTIKIAR